MNLNDDNLPKRTVNMVNVTIIYNVLNAVYLDNVLEPV